MKKITALSTFCLLLSLFLLACTASSEEPSVPSAAQAQPNVNATDASIAETNPANTSDGAYYRMTYTKSPVDIDEVMHALLTDPAQIAAFETAETNASALPDGRTIYEGTMTVDGIVYGWAECAGAFEFHREYSSKPVQAEEAERLAQDFLGRLGWAYDNNLQIRSVEDGTVDIRCRLYYHDVKLMGPHTFYFEPGNEEEHGLTGSYIQLSFSGDGINSVLIESPPQEGDILQTYDPQKDFLSLDDAAVMAEQYIETVQTQTPQPEWTLYLGSMSIERIYIPYRDVSGKNNDILMPAFEVRIPVKYEDMPEGTMVLYLDALTGYVYDTSHEFF